MPADPNLLKKSVQDCGEILTHMPNFYPMSQSATVPRRKRSRMGRL